MIESLGILKFDHLRAVAASSEEIVRLSRGEVTSPDTFDVRGFTAKSGGPFCAKIFGEPEPCACGEETRRAARIRWATASERCGECGASIPIEESRKLRFGHIALSLPLAHPFFREELARAAGLSREDLEAVLFCERFLAVADGPAGPRGTLLREDEVYASEESAPGGGAFALTGGQAIAAIVAELPAVDGVRPADWMLTAVPVLPAVLRPIRLRPAAPDGEKSAPAFVLADVDEIYRRLINRNNRLRRLRELNAPEIIIRNEMRMSQEALDAVFYNEAYFKVLTGPGRRALQSLFGRFGSLEALRDFLRRFDEAVASGQSSLDHPGEHAESLGVLRALAFTIQLS